MNRQLVITLPDGSKREYPVGTTALQVAESIGAGLAQAALAAKVNGELVDLTGPLSGDCALSILTFRDAEGQEIYRHSASHLMAMAIKRLWPHAKLAIGPAIADGFYYDLDLPERLSQEELLKIEEEMKKIVSAKAPARREVFQRAQARALFEKMSEPYKVEMIDDLPADVATISVYHHGEEFTDMCRGPHLRDFGQIKAFKLLSVAGAYWRGDEKNAMLQRIYGVAFPDKKLLAEHIKMIEEAKQRDHRLLGKQLDLFSFHEEGPGFPFFHPKGMIVYNALMEYCREELRKRGYQEIRTPLILSEDIWHRSGHWDHYRENMYFTKIDERDFAVKPMNCPGGLLYYKTNLHSYRDLPMRIAEFGQVHRHEKSGVLHGLFRVRTFTQDDAHIFCSPEQLEDEIAGCIDFVFTLYRTCGFEDVHLELSTRPENSIGSDEVWELATNALRHSLEKAGIQFKTNPGDGAFYGPKIDFHVRDCLKRSWQCATIQVDFSMPERFDLTYVAADQTRKRPVMVHRAIFGSVERFLGIMIEHFAGAFPLWLAPVQVVVIPVADEFNDYGERVRAALAQAGIRVELDSRSEKMGSRLRDAEMKKVPVMLVVGEKEKQARFVSLRRHKIGQAGTPTLDEAVAMLKQEIAERKIVQ
ncbi:MAG: threonine--tRNA ligase [Candidatus Sumerlaeota bacterium]|nr:threonine--tRNA ligase [Candidatus Sumerlaeota bacterium]